MTLNEQAGRLADSLQERAESTGTTKSALIRDAIDAFLAEGADAQQAGIQRFRSAVANASGVPPPPAPLIVTSPKPAALAVSEPGPLIVPVKTISSTSVPPLAVTVTALASVASPAKVIDPTAAVYAPLSVIVPDPV